MLVVILPNGFHLAHAAKDYGFDHPAIVPVANAERLDDLNLGSQNLPAITNAVHQLLQNPQQDVITLALDNLNAFSSWLVVEGRVLPLAYADEVFFQSHGRALSVYSESPFLASRPLRVVLVVSRSIESDRARFQALKQRFPQATAWQKVPDDRLPDSAIAIYFTDLAVVPHRVN